MIDEKWKALDFQDDVRPEQQSKLNGISQEVTQIDQKLQANNDRHLAQIDASYSQTSQLEKDLVS